MTTPLRTALARILELETALGMFVPHYHGWMDEHHDDHQIYTHKHHTFGQLRAARVLLDANKRLTP